MSGWGPKLPVDTDKSDGLALTKTLQEVVKQHLKMLVLTSPGEKVMSPDFGVGIKQFLFQPNIPLIYGEIDSRIRKQAIKYLPYLKIHKVNFVGPAEDSHVGENRLNITITYRIVPLNTMDQIALFFLTHGFVSNPQVSDFSTPGNEFTKLPGAGWSS